MVNLFIFHVLPYSNSFFSFRFVSFLISCVRSRYIYIYLRLLFLSLSPLLLLFIVIDSSSFYTSFESITIINWLKVCDIWQTNTLKHTHIVLYFCVRFFVSFLLLLAFLALRQFEQSGWNEIGFKSFGPDVKWNCYLFTFDCDRRSRRKCAASKVTICAKSSLWIWIC